MLIDLAMRHLRQQGSGTQMGLKRSLKVSLPIATAIFEQLRRQQLIDVRGMAGNDYIFSLTSAAQGLAAERSQFCRYAGPVPVPLQQYATVVLSQRVSLKPTSDQLAHAFSDLVLPADSLHQLGTALTSGRPVFIYGPSGTGKTSIIERLPRLFADTILVPYCVEADGQIISVFDPAAHIPLDLEPDELVDQRWVRCRRPCVISGGELVPELLSLRFDENTGTYAAPLQMKAANGILGIDDFGRQTMSPHALFNRWILALDRKVDNLAFQHGYMFRVPFELLLVFSTNLRPTDLGDEAFFRRIPNKMYLGPVAPELFDAISERVLTRHGLAFTPEVGRYLRELCTEHSEGLRACQPRDICEILVALAQYERKPFAATPQNLSRAARLYFMQSEPTEADCIIVSTRSSSRPFGHPDVPAPAQRRTASTDVTREPRVVDDDRECQR
jgi:predicted ATPase with chaperone activity